MRQAGRGWIRRAIGLATQLALVGFVLGFVAGCGLYAGLSDGTHSSGSGGQGGGGGGSPKPGSKEFPFSVAESVVSIIGTQSSATESATGPANSLALAGVGSYAVESCSYASARETCNSTGVENLLWRACSVNGYILIGTWTERWSSGFCPSGTLPGPLISGASVNRQSPFRDLVTYASAGTTLSSGTPAQTTYDGVSLPSTGITISMSGSVRTIVIDGIHHILERPNGTVLFDYSVTSTGVTVEGERSAGNRVANGDITLYQNTASYMAQNTLNNVAWGQAGCCFPTSGSVSTVYSGTRTGSSLLSFSSTCGSASFMDVDGAVSDVTLTQCR
jgi:hypothetical protein